ncbi:MAG: hypothetical protein ACKPCM_09775 [Pseudanabaena sp.]
MDDISGGNSQKIKKKTIAQAILEVMGETNRPMTSQEICQLILERNLYQFNTNDPLKMVRDALKRHAIESKVKKASPHRYFEQNDKQWHPSKEFQNNTKDKSEVILLDLEDSLYDYIFELEE